MPPDRKQRNKHHKKTQRGPIVRPDGSVQHKIPALEARDAAQLPGVNKLKAQLRQARRLLAKDKLDSGIKVATERRIKSLENDLRLAERRGVEKKNGQKYHAVSQRDCSRFLSVSLLSCSDPRWRTSLLGNGGTSNPGTRALAREQQPRLETG